MSLKSIAGNALVLTFLWITFWGFTHTVFRQGLGFPLLLTYYSYGMIAPYQTPGSYNQRLYVEGQTESGSWEAIDINSFYPVLYGEANIRQLDAFQLKFGNDEDRLSSKEMYAGTLHKLLQKQGKNYSMLRFYWQKWPLMTGDAYRVPEITKTDSVLLYEENFE